MTIDDIQLADIGTLYPVDEITARKIDLKNHMNGDFKATITSILEAIVKYNSQWTNDKDKNFRIFYYLRIGKSSVLVPNFERLSPNKSSLIVSVDGEALKRNIMLEVIDINSIDGIGSDLFDLEGFTETIDHNMDLGELIKKNCNKIKEMYKEWCSFPNRSDKGFVELFNQHLNEINSMTSYNNKHFFFEKRKYILTFLDYLDHKIEQPSATDELSTQDFIELRKHFEIRPK